MEMMEEEETGVRSHPEVRGDFSLPSNTHPTRCPSRLPVLLCNPSPLLNLPTTSVNFMEGLEKESSKGWRQEVDAPSQNQDPNIRT